MLSVGAICFEDSFCTRRKSWTDLWVTVNMATVVLLAVQKPWLALRGLLVCFLAQTGIENTHYLVGNQFLAFMQLFSLEEHTLVRVVWSKS